jgi:hypothetical protein
MRGSRAMAAISEKGMASPSSDCREKRKIVDSRPSAASGRMILAHPMTIE